MLKLKDLASPLFIRKRTFEISPMGETIEVSEGLLGAGGGTITDDGMSDISNT